MTAKIWLIGAIIVFVSGIVLNLKYKLVTQDDMESEGFENTMSFLVVCIAWPIALLVLAFIGLFWLFKHTLIPKADKKKDSE